MSLQDIYKNLKLNIVGTKTSDIDSKLDSAIKDISAYKSQSGRNGYIDLVKSLISKHSSIGGLESGFGVMSQGAVTPSAMGQGDRLLRYKAYDSILEYINYCKRALDVLTDNILSPDDITKIALDIKPKSFLEDEVPTEAKTSHVKETVKKLKIEKNLGLIVRTTIAMGDFFVEIADSKTAVMSRAVIAESEYLNDLTDSKEIIESINIEDYKVKVDFSSIYESDDKDDKDDKSKIPIEKLVLVFHDPKRVIKLQSEMFPFCFGYLIFPKLAIQPSLAIQDQTINQVCTSILRSIEKRIPQIKEVSDNADLKKTIEFMLKTSNPSNLSVRFVSADKVQHFQVPSLKYYPYGESIFDSCKFSAKVLIALETALTIHRLNRSTEKRKVSIEVGLPRDAKKLIENIKEELRKRKVSIDTFGTVDTIACFSLDTKIRLTYGYSMSLGDIIKQFENGKYMEVYSYDHKTGKLCPDKIVNAKITGRDVEVVKVTLDNNKSELCTPDHLWMLRDGSYKEAKDLKEGDSLMPFYRKSSSLNAKGLKYEVLYHPHNRWELTHRAFGKYLGMVEDISYKAIHHKDKNPQNNCTLNLEGLTRSQHAKIHSKDLDGGFNGSSIGNEVPIIKSNCVICGKLIITPYNHKGIVCSKECLEIYRKDYSLNSWISRKDKNEYELYNVKCSNCGKELKISKSKYISRKHDLFSCDNEICKKRLDYLARVYARNPNGYIEIEYKNCLACGKLFVLKKGSGRILCSRKCTTSYASNNRVTKIETKCDNCGKKIFILDRLFNIENRFNYCEDKKCTENISRLNTSISKNGGKSYSNVEFGKCIICGIPTSFSNKKPGYKYRTCGSKSCSSKVMHRSTNYINNVEHAVLNHKVKSVELIETRIDVGDIQTEKFHNFALDSGVIVHNSSITSFEDVYIPMKDGKPFVDISTFNDGGVDVRGKVDELKLLRDQLISSLGVPPAFIGIEEGQSWKTTLSEENMLFARTIIAHQKYLSEQINDLIQKIYNITDPEESLTILDNIQISFMAPKSLQFEREARYMGELANLVRTLEEVGVPKEYSKKKYLHGIDWEEIENYEIDSTIDKKIGTKKDESGGMGGGF